MLKISLLYKKITKNSKIRIFFQWKIFNFVLLHNLHAYICKTNTDKNVFRFVSTNGNLWTRKAPRLTASCSTAASPPGYSAALTTDTSLSSTLERPPYPRMIASTQSSFPNSYQNTVRKYFCSA